jgi:hypothetical protein
MTERSLYPLTKEAVIEFLQYGRDEFSEEIPTRILNSTDGNYKVRGAWFVGIAACLSEAKADGILPVSLKEDVDTFMSWFKRDFGKRTGSPPLSTKEDIEKGNEIINKVLEALGAGSQTDMTK